MIKSAQNIIGSVMCCPGCFSLYRFEAIDDVIDTFSMPTESMSDVFTKDNGNILALQCYFRNRTMTIKSYNTNLIIFSKFQNDCSFTS